MRLWKQIKVGAFAQLPAASLPEFSGLLSWSSQVRSIPHALMLLGHRGVRKWISLVAIACMGEDKPRELIVLPLIRARFCELLAPVARLAGSSNDLFLLGLLSAIDAILDMNMDGCAQRNRDCRGNSRRSAWKKQTSYRRRFGYRGHVRNGFLGRDSAKRRRAEVGIPDEVLFRKCFFNRWIGRREFSTGEQMNEAEPAVPANREPTA